MASGDVYLYPNEMDRLLHQPGGVVGRYCNLFARQVAAESARIASTELRVRTGRYSGGFRTEVEVPGPSGEGFQYKVVNTATGQDPRRSQDYASVIEYGSAAHPISARKRSQPLVFYVNGRKVVTQQVNHPGTRPRNIMSRALARVASQLGSGTIDA